MTVSSPGEVRGRQDFLAWRSSARSAVDARASADRRRVVDEPPIWTARPSMPSMSGHSSGAPSQTGAAARADLPGGDAVGAPGRAGGDPAVPGWASDLSRRTCMSSPRPVVPGATYVVARRVTSARASCSRRTRPTRSSVRFGYAASARSASSSTSSAQARRHVEPPLARPRTRPRDLRHQGRRHRDPPRAAPLPRTRLRTPVALAYAMRERVARFVESARRRAAGCGG
jgi:hypothetical protein